MYVRAKCQQWMSREAMAEIAVLNCLPECGKVFGTEGLAKIAKVPVQYIETILYALVRKGVLESVNAGLYSVNRRMSPLRFMFRERHDMDWVEGRTFLIGHQFEPIKTFLFKVQDPVSLGKTSLYVYQPGLPVQMSIEQNHWREIY